MFLSHIKGFINLLGKQLLNIFNSTAITNIIFKSLDFLSKKSNFYFFTSLFFCMIYIK